MPEAVAHEIQNPVSIVASSLFTAERLELFRQAVLSNGRGLAQDDLEAFISEDPNQVIRSTREAKDHGRLQLDQLVWGTQSGSTLENQWGTTSRNHGSL